MYKKSRVLYSVLTVLFGTFMFVYGEIDDSPGGQALGLIAVIIGIAGVIKSKKKFFTKIGSSMVHDTEHLFFRLNY